MEDLSVGGQEKRDLFIEFFKTSFIHLQLLCKVGTFFLEKRE